MRAQRTLDDLEPVLEVEPQDYQIDPEMVVEPHRSVVEVTQMLQSLGLTEQA